ncbi:MAG: acyltransferase family protein [Deltaproteobacteria bacterium]|jgi:1-acyl-sn-glycerol-3-phosphate acyltransferase|nr:acyltransferase family protein [Deltaproteobacteria bacterium]
MSRLSRFVDRLIPDRVLEKTAQLPADVGELGVDPFGYDPKLVKYVATPVEWLYRQYFRVQVHGMANVPDGRVLLVANHSGQLPFDGMMIGTSLILDRDPPRMARSMVEKWSARLPFVSVFFARVGQIVGTPENCRRLLAREEAIMVFPEGARGISKTFDKRYQLERFGQGFMRLALETNTPIVPIAVVGAEEQAPSFANIESLAKLMQMPAFPVTPTFPLLGPLGLLPLPSRYSIYFGEPMRFEGHGDEEDEVIFRYVSEVKAKIEEMLEAGLKARTSIYL